MTELLSSSTPYVVLIGGVPRTGTTWLFNVARLLFEHAGHQVHCAWSSDYDATNPAAIHLVKAHSPDEAKVVVPSTVLITKRDVAESVASRIRMGWLKNCPEEIVRSAKSNELIYAYWEKRFDYQVEYRNIKSCPTREIAAIAEVLRIGASENDIAYVAKQLDELKEPEEGSYDPVTLLHPNHRGTHIEASILTEQVRQVLTKQSL